jgi:hypothetical protein
MAALTPLQRNVKVQRAADRELALLLKDAADEAEKIILKIGSKDSLRKAQLQALLKPLRKMQHDLWGGVSKATETGMQRAAEAAAEAEIAVNRVLFKAGGLVMADFDEAMRIQAQAALSNVLAKGANNISLSRQVYKTEALNKKLVDKAVKRGLLLNFSAKEMAASIRHLIDPDVRGGVSYAANRLARTEINNAFHRSQIDLRKGDPWTEGFKWHLSGSHPRPDACNEYADGVHFEGGEPGVYEVDNVPGKPHPQCLCFLTTETIDEDEFIAGMASGKFDSFINNKVDEFGV